MPMPMSHSTTTRSRISHGLAYRHNVHHQLLNKRRQRTPMAIPTPSQLVIEMAARQQREYATVSDHHHYGKHRKNIPGTQVNRNGGQLKLPWKCQLLPPRHKYDLHMMCQSHYYYATSSTSSTDANVNTSDDATSRDNNNANCKPMVSEEGERLYKSSLRLLEQIQKSPTDESSSPSSSVHVLEPSSTKDISQLIQEWMDFFYGNGGGSRGPGRGGDDIILTSGMLDTDLLSLGNSSPIASTATSTSQNVDPKTLHQWMNIVDQLAHTLLDIRASYSRESQMTDLTTYMALFNQVLSLWARVPPSRHNGVKAGELLSRILGEGNRNENLNLDHPTFMSYFGTILACTRSRYEYQYDSYNDKHFEGGDNNDDENENEQKSHQERKNMGAREAYRWLQKMEEMGAAGRSIITRSGNGEIIGGTRPPTLPVYNACLHGYAIRGMVQEAEELIQRLEQMSQSQGEGREDAGNRSNEDSQQSGQSPNPLRPDVITYSTLFNAYQKSESDSVMINGQRMDIATRAQNVLQTMMERYDASDGDITIRPNQFTFGSVISLVATSKSIHNREQKADEVLQSMLEFCERERERGNVNANMSDEDKQRYSLDPSRAHFVSVLLAYSKLAKNSKSAVERMEELLLQMETMDDDDAKPDYRCFVMYLDALSKSMTNDGPQKAEDVLSRIEAMMMEEQKQKHKQEWNNYGYNLVIDAWSRHRKPGRAKKAEAIFERMNRLYEQTGNEALLPDKITYTSLIRAIVKDREEGFAQRCANLLAEMEAGSDRMKPDFITYASVIHAQGIGLNLDMAETLVRKMESDEETPDPSRSIYDHLMSAYKAKLEESQRRSNDQDRGIHSGDEENRLVNKTLETLEKLEESYRNGNHAMKPTARTYGICFLVLARSRDPNRFQRAEEIFQRCIDNCLPNNRQKYNNNEYFMNAVNNFADIYGRSNQESKVHGVLAILRQLQELGIEPDIIFYNILLKTCSRLPPNALAESKQHAIHVTVKTLKFLQDNDDPALSPDSISYNNAIFSCRNNMDDERERAVAIEAVFRRCCTDGYLTKVIIGTLSRATGDNFWDIVGLERKSKRYVEVQELDPRWSRNAMKISNRTRYHNLNK